MKNIGWLLLGGGVLYWLYESGVLGATTTTPAVSTSTTPQANDGTATGTTSKAAVVTLVQGPNGPVPAPTTLADIYTQILNWATPDPGFTVLSDGMLAGSSYQWATLLNLVFPKAAPVDLGVMLNGADPSAQIRLDAWWLWAKAYLQSKYGLSGLGMIAHHVNPYLQGPRPFGVHQVFGANLAPNGMETYVTRLGQN